MLKLIPTENTTVTNEFVNNISKYKNFIFFLNSYGTLYSINSETMDLKWFINLNPSLNLNQSNIFDGSEIINNGSKIVVSSNENTFLITWNQNLDSSLTNLLTSYRNIIMSICGDDIQDCVQSIKSLLVIIHNNGSSIKEIIDKIKIIERKIIINGFFLNALDESKYLILNIYLKFPF